MDTSAGAGDGAAGRSKELTRYELELRNTVAPRDAMPHVVAKVSCPGTTLFRR